MEIIKALTSDDPTLEEIKTARGFLFSKWEEHNAAIEQWECRITELRAAESSSQAEQTEVEQLREYIETARVGLRAINQYERKLDAAEARLLAEREITEFDSTATRLVELSTRIGTLAAEFADLWQQAGTVSEELNNIAFRIMPADSPVRREWANGLRIAQLVQRGPGLNSGGADSIFQIDQLKQAASLGDFVRSRMDSLRAAIKSSLRQ